MDALVVLLPGGYIGPNGQLHREVELRPLTGREEEFLAASGQQESASLVTAILSRCITRLGAISPVTEQLTRELLVADRQYLLLKLRELTFSELIRANIFCPWPDCGKRVALNFSIDDIPVREAQDRRLVYTMTLSPEVLEKPEIVKQVAFRLPNGADQEIIAPLLTQNEALALTKLLEHCIQATDGLSSAEIVAQLSPAARLAIEQHMEGIAPKIDSSMDVNCHECGRQFSAPFDIHQFFFGEFKSSEESLYREVHYLAYHYHWSEREIMDMTRAKRQKYIEVLADEIERLNDDA